MDSPEVTFTLAYLVLAVCFVFTPTEFHSAGLTVQNLLSGWLGSEDAAFVRYHQRRTAATLLCHSLLPLGYYVGMCFAASEKRLFLPSQAPQAWQLFLLLAVSLPVISWSLIYYWSRDRWARHPLARTLALYALPQSGWQAVASSVDTEFRRIDKFATGVPGARVIVTDTWVMKVTTCLTFMEHTCPFYTPDPGSSQRAVLGPPWSCARTWAEPGSGGETWLRHPWGCPWRPRQGPLLPTETLGFP
uniref:Transmembrane protein 129, E3 ubiquitin ligase n=1 Tax=Pipistrellus kuhlii TaxID=59472 RepID=A0A7J7RW35_PIPKU|nr:transmembrane protein 129, E3 ubiquitin ligase [Pipistrellus kuhlii]